MARRKGNRRTTRRRRSFRRSRRGSSPIVTEILPLTLGAAAAMIPFVAQDPNGYSVLTDIQTAAGGDIQALQEVPYHIGYGFTNNLGDIALLIASAVGVKWAGRKFGLTRATRITKKISLF